MTVTPEYRLDLIGVPAPSKIIVRGFTLKKIKHTHCEACGLVGSAVHKGGRDKWSILAHHPDYDRPRFTVGVCASCHPRVHAGKIPEPRTGRIRVWKNGLPRWVR